jgi:hypothetical protein
VDPTLVKPIEVLECSSLFLNRALPFSLSQLNRNDLHGLFSLDQGLREAGTPLQMTRIEAKAPCNKS